MSMSCKAQKVLVIQDATKELSSSSIRWVLNGLSLQPHDKMILLGIIKPLVTSADTSPEIGCCMLSKRKLDSSSSLNLKQEFVNQETERKLNEYQNNPEIREILQLYETQQIHFQIRVEAGHSLKEITVKTARSLGATCVILDRIYLMLQELNTSKFEEAIIFLPLDKVRQMKKDKKFVMENLSCGVIRATKDDMEHLRIPKPPEFKLIINKEGPSSQLECDPKTSTIGKIPEQIHESYVCSVCQNKRPNFANLEEFTYWELKVATDSFSPQNLLHTGGKLIYKGELTNGVKIVVKEFMSKSGNEKEFKSEVKLLGKSKHENLAILLGSCSEDGHRLLVYEYICGDSLDQCLSKKKELPWETRVKVAKEVAIGLEYLHKRGIFGNVRPSNILLTHDHNPLLTHYGLARNQYEEPDHMISGRERPEDIAKYSSKSDVFAFGVILLGLITGRRSMEDTSGQVFLKWARPLVKKKMYDELIDPMVRESHDIHQLFLMVHVAEKCLRWDPDRRLPIDKVVIAMTCIAEGREIEDFSPTEFF